MTEIERDVINYYNKGYSKSDVCLFTGLPQSKVREIIKNNRANIHREKVVRGNKAILITAIADGITDMPTLQEMTGLAKTSIYTYARIGHKHPHYNHGHTKDILQDLEIAELTQSQIAKKYGVSRQAVSAVKKQYNL